ncbi:VPS37B subunit of ESCRT-I b [Conger conger]|uniref:VPS37B subunit of ESCRT-I b n=1 Tax=Conger conger TaxID=82655 RepID=UPI002A5ABBE7|nr:VPS37B subunit of ESCRT-I b [Conger conger]
MSGFTEKLSSYTMTQLNELLEDEEKLNKIVQDLEEGRVKAGRGVVFLVTEEKQAPVEDTTYPKLWFPLLCFVTAKSMRYTQGVQQSKDVVLAGNRSLAEQNLLLQPSLDLQKNELTKRYRCLQELFESFQLRKSTLDHKLGSGSMDTLLALLQAEGAKIEEETEKMADLFLDGGQPLESFVDDYQSKRKLAHLRRVKIDRLREMVLRGVRMPQAPVVQPTPAPAPQLAPEADTNGSPTPAPRRSPTQPAQPASAQPAGLSGFPYPPCPYPSVPPQTGYASAFLPEGLGPQPGFIMQ